MSVSASLTQLVLLSAGHVWGPTRRGWGSWTGRDKMRPLDRRNSSVPGRIPACAQREERRRNQDVHTPQTRALWPSRASCKLGLSLGWQQHQKWDLLCRLFILLVSQDVLQNQSCWEHPSPTFLPWASGGAKSQIIPEPGGEMRCPHCSNDVLYA